jgi:hypothetical protein
MYAPRTDLTGANHWESALCDMFVDNLQDISPKLRAARMAANKDDKAKAVCCDDFRTGDIFLTERGNGQFDERGNAELFAKL